MPHTPLGPDWAPRAPKMVSRAPKMVFQAFPRGRFDSPKRSLGVFLRTQTPNLGCSTHLRLVGSNDCQMLGPRSRRGA